VSPVTARTFIFLNRRTDGNEVLTSLKKWCTAKSGRAAILAHVYRVSRLDTRQRPPGVPALFDDRVSAVLLLLGPFFKSVTPSESRYAFAGTAGDSRFLRLPRSIQGGMIFMCTDFDPDERSPIFLLFVFFGGGWVGFFVFFVFVVALD